MVHQRRRITAGGALCATIALLLTGCGGSSSGDSSNLSARQELSKGVSALGNSDKLTADLKVAVTKGQLLALNSGQPKDQQITGRVAGLIAGTDIVVVLRTPDGKTLSQATKAGANKKPLEVSMKADVDNTDVFDVRQVAGALYLRADVKKILSLAGSGAPDIATLKAQVPQQLGFAQAALDGKWVSISAADLKKLTTQLGGGSAQQPNEGQREQFLLQLNKIVNSDVTVRRVDTGDSGDHLLASGNARMLVGDLVKAVQSIAPGNPAVAAFDPTKVPNKNVALDAYVKDGTLSALSLDLTQFASGQDAKDLAGKHLPIRVDFTQDAATIQKPDGATPVNVTALLGILGTLLSQPAHAA